MAAGGGTGTPLISVLLPVHNGRPFLQAALGSLKRQTFRNFEIIAVDDGSTDDTADLLKYQTAGLNITFLRNSRRQGVTPSLRRAASVARGEFLARQDADDLSHPRRFSLQIQTLRRNPEVVLVGCDYEVMDVEGKRLAVEKPPRSSGDIVKALEWRNVFAHGSVMMRRKAYEHAGGYDKKLAFSQDFDLYRRLSDIGRIATIPKILYRWRKNPSSIEGRHRDIQNAYASYILAGKPRGQFRFIQARRGAWRWHFRAEEQLRRGDPHGALRPLLEAHRRAPDNFLSTYLLASVWEKLGRFQKSAELFRVVREMGPEELRSGAEVHLEKMAAGGAC